MANIKEIARQAGVSVSTVSRVLNNHPYVSEEKRNRVMDTIKQLKYARNMNAVHLITGRTMNIAIMLPFVNHVYFSALMEGVGKGALSASYRLILCQTGYSQDKEREALDMLRNREVDGIVVLSSSISPSEIEAYCAYGPIVCCQDAGERQFSSVYINHTEAFRKAIRYLIRKGHRHIGFTVGRMDSPSTEARLIAYREMLEELGEPYRKEWILDRCLDIEDGAAIMERLFVMKERPSALLVTGDHVAAGLIYEAERRGVSIPEELAVIGFDNHPIGRMLGLTTIDNQLLQMGEMAFAILHEHIEGTQTAPVRHELDFELIERASV
ncbi:LacI family DNA-binding transcriptional regulator [Paenibacillus cisolokensis]|uniref:LacI family DNA-binding transcriptional regulator n=1 Tax=Paenibacillus campinasensis TaxID=66347 RepID=A0ABW9T6K1_9BACL|nr:LacI family DNA-binding transcriptional regulator [Paenibacillus campinasensis]MUG68277.1 LacI family DNA-binding transcriptional regulator [Paenibacillus campinasensis]